MRAFLLLILLAVTVAASPFNGVLDSEVTDIIVSLTEDTAIGLQHDFSVTSAAAADAAGDLGKPIGRRLRRLPRNSGESLEQQLQRLNGLKGVKYAVPDLRVTPAAVHPDSSSAAVPQTLPGGGSKGVFRSYQWGMSRVGAPYAWSIATGAKDKQAAVTVCVVDSGIDDKHPGLKPNLARGVGMNAVNGEDEFDLTDVLGHGTTLAGVIAGTGAEDGPVGLNWDNINLLSCKFMGPQGYGSTSDAVQCIDYCLQQRSHIISASWTTGTMPNPPLEEAVARTAEAGALLVLAAGNFGANMKQVPYYPQVYSRQYDNVLVVAASDDYDEHIFFSNFDPSSVHLSAPGVMIYTTEVGGGYNFTSGTSIAAPFVSGAAALLQAVAQDQLNTTLSATELKQHLLDSAERLAALLGRSSTAGRLRVDWALQLLLGKALSPPTPCLARPNQRTSKCRGGRGGGRLPARRSLVEMGEYAGAGSSMSTAAQGGAHSRPFRSTGMQRELVRQLEQQQQQEQEQQQGTGQRRRVRRLHALTGTRMAA